MKESGKITYWNIPVPKRLDQALEEAIRGNWHRTKSEFIRELVRRALEEKRYRFKTNRRED
jgi:metal-responsive CopG/Arc/MetJ family transcriptional regulator